MPMLDIPPAEFKEYKGIKSVPGGFDEYCSPGLDEVENGSRVWGTGCLISSGIYSRLFLV